MSHDTDRNNEAAQSESTRQHNQTLRYGQYQQGSTIGVQGSMIKCS